MATLPHLRVAHLHPGMPVKYGRGLRSRANFKQDETRLEGNSRIGVTGTRLLFSGPVGREIREIKRDGTVAC